jgi:hypothetical protein
MIGPERGGSFAVSPERDHVKVFRSDSGAYVSPPSEFEIGTNWAVESDRQKGAWSERMPCGGGNQLTTFTQSPTRVHSNNVNIFKLVS